MMNKILKFTITSIILIFLFQINLLAQTKYLNGTIVLNNNDSLHGLIGYKDIDKNPNTISFKLNNSSASKEYTPLDIKAFKVNNDEYQSGIVDILTSPNQIDKLERNPIISVIKDTVFLQVLVKGIKSLYFNNSPKGFETYYIGTDTGITILKYKKYFIDNEYNTREVNSYFTTLNQYLSDCTSIQNKILKTSYNKYDLMSLFESYYKCNNSGPNYTNKSYNLKSKFGVFGGVSLTKIKLSSNHEDFIFLSKSEKKNSINPTIGLSYELIFPRSKGQWAFYNELQFTTYKSELYYENHIDFSNYEKTRGEIGFSQINLNNCARFNLQLNKSLKLFINAGISSAFTVSSVNKKTSEKLFFTILHTTEGKSIPTTQQIENGGLFGLGVSSNKFYAEIRGQVTNSMSNIVALKSGLTKVFLLVGYQF